MVCAGAKGSWQDKCSLPKNASQEEAIEFFKGMGFKTEQMKWDEDGGLKLINYHPGFVKDPQTGQDVWWNIIHTGSLKAGDGTPFPKKMVQEIQSNGWDHTYAFKLKPGIIAENQARHAFNASTPSSSYELTGASWQKICDQAGGHHAQQNGGLRRQHHAFM